jgi:hypothetical protein
MTKQEVLEATIALDAWLKSQNIPPFMKAIVLVHWLAAEIVDQGNTPSRYETGLRIMSKLLEATTREALSVAKEQGIR